MIVAALVSALAGHAEAAANRAQTAIVEQFMADLQQANYAAAFRLLNPAARTYFREAANLRSVYTADGFRVERFTIVGRRAGSSGAIVLVRETARFRDHAHDVTLRETATVSLGVVPVAGAWRIKDPGHPWRAFAPRALAARDGLTVSVKKVSFYARRIEAVVTFENRSPSSGTLLPYAKSILRDAAGTRYPIIETRDWSLTDKVLFEGLRLAPSAEYTGTLAFSCGPLDDRPRRFSLTIAPILFAGADLPFSLDVSRIAATAR